MRPRDLSRSPDPGEREESDQLPEEGPDQQVPDDQSGSAREGADETPGVPGEDDLALGRRPGR